MSSFANIFVPMMPISSVKNKKGTQGTMETDAKMVLISRADVQIILDRVQDLEKKFENITLGSCPVSKKLTYPSSDAEETDTEEAEEAEETEETEGNTEDLDEKVDVNVRKQAVNAYYALMKDDPAVVAEARMLLEVPEGEALDNKKAWRTKKEITTRMFYEMTTARRKCAYVQAHEDMQEEAKVDKKAGKKKVAKTA
jgi:hypothetical protein